MNITIKLKSGKEYQMEIKDESNIDRFTNRLNKSRQFIKFGKLILNVNEIESIEIE